MWMVVLADVSFVGDAGGYLDDNADGWLYFLEF